MHIILGILGAIAAASYWWFVIRRTSDAAGEALDVAQRARGAFKRRAFSKKVDGSVLTAVDDPGTAAIIVLARLAAGRERLTENQHQHLLEIARDKMQLADPEEAVGFAAWAATQIDKPADITKTFKPMFQNNLTHGERQALTAMGAHIVTENNRGSEEQQDLLQALHDLSA